MRLHIQRPTQFFFLSFIVTLGLLLRIYKLGTDPAGFFCDEASVGYNAFTILNFGTDEYGSRFPLFFKAFGEYKNPVEIYSTVPSISLFGLNEWGTRFPEAIYGTACIVAVFFLAKELLGKKYGWTFGLVTALFLAISPWHIQFSRVALEGLMPYVLFTILGTLFFLKKQNGIRYILLTCLCFLLALYSYFPARIFIPLFVGMLFIYDWRYFLNQKKIFLLMACIFILGSLPMLNAYIHQNGLIRFQQVSIFAHPPKYESIALHITQNYISHFSLNFLFFKGDTGMPGQFVTRQSIRDIGEFYLWQLPLMIIGGIFLLKKKNWRTVFVLLTWFILYPTGSMLTTDISVQATRSIIGIIPFELLSAIGFVYTVVYLGHNSLRSVFALVMGGIILLSLLNYTQRYFVAYPMYASDFWGWQFGPRDIVHYFQTQKGNYDQFIMQPEFNAPYIFFKFYAPTDCKKCLLGTPDSSFHPQLRQLFAVTPEYLEQYPRYSFRVLHSIYYPNHTIAFLIGQIVQ